MFEHLQVRPVDTSQKAAGSGKEWRVGQQTFSNAVWPNIILSDFFQVTNLMHTSFIL